MKMAQSYGDKNAVKKGSARMRNLAGEGASLDNTIALTNEIIDMGSNAVQGIDDQTNKLKNTNNILGVIETKSIPGADQLISLINKAEQKNTIILAFVIALCLAALLYAVGFIDLLKTIFGINKI